MAGFFVGPVRLDGRRHERPCGCAPESAEPTLRDLLKRDRDLSRRSRERLRAAAFPPDLSLLENAQQLHLHRRRDFAYFVEQDRSGVRFFERPRMVLQSTCECTSCVPEQLALEKSFDNGPTIYGNESASSSRRCLYE
jgi:hypothetical protein